MRESFKPSIHMQDRDLDHDHMPPSLDIRFVAVPESSKRNSESEIGAPQSLYV